MRSRRSSALGGLVLGLCAVVVVLMPLRGNSAPTELPRRGGTLVVGIWQEPVTLLWPQHATPYAMSMMVMTTINDPLIAVDDQNRFVPRLLREVPTRDNGGIALDGMTYTLKLRPGLRWHDGQPVTLRDFAFTWRWITDPGSGAVYRRGWDSITSVDVAADGLTATVRLKNLYVPFLENVLAHGFLLPEHVLTRTAPREFARRPVGTGPFRFVEWLSGSHITVERNPAYWQQGKPYLDRIVFKVVPDRAVMLAQAQTAEVQIGINFSEAQLGDLERLRDVRLVNVFPATLERWLFNLNDPRDLSQPHPIFADVRARQAVVFATDRVTMIKTILRGATTEAVNMLQNTPWFAKDLKPYPVDPARARELLDRAGWRLGPDGIRVKEGVRFSFVHSTTAGDPTREAMQVVMQQNLREVGIEMRIQNYPPPRFFGSWATGAVLYRRQWDMAGHANGLTGLDPDLYTWWHSSQIPSERRPTGFNFTGFWTPSLDRVLEELNETPDPKRRRALLDRAQRMVYNSYALMPMFNRILINSVHHRVRGLRPSNPQAFVGLFWNSEEWWMTR